MKNNVEKSLTPKQLSVLCLQFYIVLKAGIPIDSGISAIRESIEDKYLKGVVQRLEKEVLQCDEFHSALKKCMCFPDYMVNMIEIGERTGNLDTICLCLSDYYERENKLKENIRTAVTYPVILILMITAVMAVLVIKILPVLSKVIRNLSGDMPSGSNTAINIGQAVGRYSFAVVVVIAFIAGIMWIFGRTAKGKRKLVSVADKIPSVHRAMNKIGAARFSSVMSMLIESGYDTEQALSMLPGILPTENTARKAIQCQKEIENGADFSQALYKTGFFTGLYPSMIKIGIKTGTLDIVMKNIAKNCDDDAQTSLSNIVSCIEPAMIGFLSVIIGCVLISNILPLVGVISSVG